MKEKTTCIVCNKQYSPSQKKKIIKKIKSTLPHFIKTYPSTCIHCIQEELATAKQSYTSNLETAASTLKQARKAYQQAAQAHAKAKASHANLSLKYKTIDEQESYITFFMTRPEKVPTQPTKKKRKKSIKKQSALIKALLASMTPEQRSSIEVKIAKLPTK